MKVFFKKMRMEEQEDETNNEIKLCQSNTRKEKTESETEEIDEAAEVYVSFS